MLQTHGKIGTLNGRIFIIDISQPNHIHIVWPSSSWISISLFRHILMIFDNACHIKLVTIGCERGKNAVFLYDSVTTAGLSFVCCQTHWFQVHWTAAIVCRPTHSIHTHHTLMLRTLLLLAWCCDINNNKNKQKIKIAEWTSGCSICVLHLARVKSDAKTTHIQFRRNHLFRIAEVRTPKKKMKFKSKPPLKYIGIIFPTTTEMYCIHCTLPEINRKCEFILYH